MFVTYTSPTIVLLLGCSEALLPDMTNKDLKDFFEVCGALASQTQIQLSQASHGNHRHLMVRLVRGLFVRVQKTT